MCTRITAVFLGALLLASVAAGGDRNKINNVETILSAKQLAASAATTIIRDVATSDVLGVSYAVTSTQTISQTIDFTYANDQADTFTAATSQDGTVYTTRVTISGASPQRGLTDIVVPPCVAIKFVVTNSGTGMTTSTVRIFTQ